MKTTKRITAWLLVSSALLAGCMSGKGGPQTTVQGTESLPGITELDGGMTLAKDLEYIITAKTRKNGFLVVQLQLHNKRGSSQAFEWKAVWFDEHGLLIDTNESWRPIVIGGRGFETVQITGPTQSAESWQLKFQKPNPVR